MATEVKSKKVGNFGLILITIMLILIIIAGSVFTGAYLSKNNNITIGSISGNIKHTSKIEEVVVSLGETTVKLANEDAHFVKANVSVGYDKSTKFEKQLDNKKTVVKDTINTSFMLLSYSDINGKNIENVKKTIVGRINKNLGSSYITNIYFDQIIVQ